MPALLVGCSSLFPSCHTQAAPAGRPPRPDARPAEASLAPAPLPAPPFESPFALGINEAVSVPQRLALTMPASDQALRLTASAQLAASVGARLVRGHTGNYPAISAWALQQNPGALGAADAWVTAVEAAGLEPVLMVSPWPGNDTAKYAQAYVPADMAAYAAYVTAVVERYDGDGVGDMPGLLRGVRYWEVDNEPDLKNSLVGKGASADYDPKTFCTPAEYAQVFLASAKAIKAASPTAKVLNGGLYRPHSTLGAAYFRDFVTVHGVLDAIDIVSVHTYHDDLDGDRLAAGIRNERYYAPQKPVWVTETSVGTTDDIDEAAQARMVVTDAARTALEGADKMFWHTLSDPPPSDFTRRMPMFGHSLFQLDADDNRTIKPVGQVYQHLAAFLAAHDLNGCVPDGTGAVKLRDGSVLLYDGSRTVTNVGGDLRTGAALVGGQTATGPAWLQ